MLSDYLRAETMMSYLQHKDPMISVPYISSPLSIKMYANGNNVPILIFIFSNKVKVSQDIGIMGDSIENIQA